ncbi:MAG TPA: hypothetical protein VFB74_22430 [Kribbellaceae bacterium]|nr:hypothetical protein [Kribbellaceae bacterium]
MSRDRDTATGEQPNKISITVMLADRTLPLFGTATDWTTARAYLASAEFHAIAGQVRSVTFTNRER